MRGVAPRDVRVAIITLMILAVGAVAPTTGTGVASQATAIDDCTTITEPGEYVLADDLRDADVEACIEIRADDVLFDGASHAIDGAFVRQGSAGVEVAPESENVAVRDLRVSRWAFGVRYEGVSGGEIENVQARFNADGVHVEDARGVAVRSVLAENNFVGVTVSRSASVVVSNVTARWSGIYGVSVAGSADVALSNVTAARDEIGIGFFETTGATVRNATVVSNRMSGLELDSATGTRVSTVTVRDNADETFVRTPRGFVGVDATDVELTRTRDSRVENVTTGREWSVALGSDSANDSVAVRTDAGFVSFSGSGVVVSSVASPPSPPADRDLLGPIVTTETTAENASLTVSVEYSETALVAAGVAESTLGFWRYEAGEGGDEGAWSPVEQTETDSDRNLVRTTVTDVAVLALLGERVDGTADPLRSSGDKR